MNITLVAAIGQQRQLGLDNQLLWQLPGDLPRFKNMTMGHSIIMGRKTYESIGKPLPGRANIILTRDSGYQVDGATVVHSIEQALVAVSAQQAVFVIGGGEIYTVFLPIATHLELTLVADSPAADAYFPEYIQQFVETARQHNQAEQLRYDYVSYERRLEQG